MKAGDAVSAHHPEPGGSRRNGPGPSGWRRLLLIALCLYACASLAWAVLSVAGGGRTGTDLHSYWYAGQFIRQRADPFPASRARQEPAAPVWFLDRADAPAGPVLQPTLTTAPTNTAPVMLLLTGLSFFSWPAARWIWAAVNLALALAMPLVACGVAARYGMHLDRLAGLAVAAAFYSLSAVRSTIGLGQTSLIILACTIAALWWADRRPVLAGVFFGLALSKYSLALPLALFLLFRRRWRVLAVGVAVQAVGLHCLSWATQTTPQQLIAGHLLVLHGAMTTFIGVHFAMLLPRGPEFAALALGLAVACLALLARRAHSLNVHRPSPALHHLLGALVLWSLLAVYHNTYDIVLVLPFYVSAAWVLAGSLPGPSAREKRWFWGVVAGAGLVLSLPGALYEALPQWLGMPADGWLGRAPPPLALLALLLAATWLLGTRRRAAGQEQPLPG